MIFLEAWLFHLPNMSGDIIVSWAYTIHKSQGKALDEVVIDLGTTEKCSGMTLVGLSRVRKLRHLLLRPFSYERLQNKQSETITDFT